MTKPEPILFLNSARGVYIPRDFANAFADRKASVLNIDDETWSVLESGPDNEGYWHAWVIIENAAVVVIDGTRYGVFEIDDCWLIPEGMEWSDDADWFVWPDCNNT